LMQFLNVQKINGVLFISGDRHHSEIIKKERNGLYPLYDITASPYTSGIGKVRGAEVTNAARVAGTLIEEQNFAKISFSGKRNERVMKVEFIGLKGNILSTWSVSEKDLK
jgi:alkaline phosphatase D